MLGSKQCFKRGEIKMPKTVVRENETLDDALDWYYQGRSENTRHGLRFILQRIDLLRSFSS